MEWIDLHCHLLYGVDDASKKISESLDMIRLAEKDGIHVIAATTHLKPPFFEHTQDELQEKVKLLQEEVYRQGYSLQIVCAAENYVSKHTMHKLKERSFIPYHEGPYILVEFPWKVNTFDDPTYYLWQFIHAGYIPVIAHPERYEWVHREYSLLTKWRSMGCLLQMNRTSILGFESLDKVHETALKMLSDGLVDLIASDAHHYFAPRYPKLSDVYRYVEKHYGATLAKRCFIDTPKRIITK